MKFLRQSKQFDFQNNAFDFVRLSLALLVVIGHSGGVGDFGWAPQLKMRDWEMTFTGLATLAVYGFFVISGFLITKSWHHSKSLQEFGGKRLRRIYPGYLVSLLVCGLVFVPIFFWLKEGFDPLRFVKLHGKETVQFVIQNLFVEVRQAGITGLSSDLQGSYLGVNSPYWSLIHEVRAYGLVAILGVVGLLQSRRFVLGLAIVFNLIYAVCSLDYVLNFGSKSLHFRDLISSYLAHYHIFIIFTYFIFGMMFYTLVDKIVWNNWLYCLSILGLIVGWKFDIFPIVAPVCFSYFTLYSSQILPFRNLAKAIGDLSYGIYIYSWPIQLCLLYLGLNKVTGNKFLDLPIYALASIVLSMAAGWLSWNLVEKRWLARKG
jgi:peptidoglycan/LPS O-acetylase OafA/YrhL